MVAREELLNRKHRWLEERRREGVEGVFKAQALALPLPPSLHDALLVPRAERAVIPRVSRALLEDQAGCRVDMAEHVGRLSGLGASAVMISTDDIHLGGGFEDVLAAAQASSLPVICQDYILDTVQLAMARAHGAAAVMLTLELLDERSLRTLCRAASDLLLDVLLDVTSARHLDLADRVRNGAGGLFCGMDLLGLGDGAKTRLPERLSGALPDHFIPMACVPDGGPVRLGELEALGYEVFVIDGSVANPDELEHRMRAAAGALTFTS